MGEKSRSKGGWWGYLLVLIVAAAIAFGIFVMVRKKHHGSKSEASPVPGPPGAVTKKYAEALNTAMQFFDVQKCIESLMFFELHIQCGLLILIIEFMFGDVRLSLLGALLKYFFSNFLPHVSIYFF